MLLIRLAQRQDLKAIVELAQSSGGGLTNLPADEATIAAKLARAVDTHQHLTDHGDGLFWFVLEETQSRRLVGVAGIESAIGLDQASTISFQPCFSPAITAVAVNCARCICIPTFAAARPAPCFRKVAFCLLRSFASCLPTS